MSKNRGKRSRSKKFAVQLKVRDEEQLERTLDLRGVKADRPSINGIIGVIANRLEREEVARALALAKRWCGRGWSQDMVYDCMGEEDYPGRDDEYPYDGIMSKSSRKLKKLNKKLFKKEKHRGSEEDDYWENRHTMFTRDEWSDDNLDDEDDYEEQYKCIKFYTDIENEMSVREFYSLKDFSDFCGENNYIMSTTDYNNLLNWTVIHCCLDPISEEYGEHEIITDNSYGALYWTVSEDGVKYSESSVNARTFTD